MFGKHNQRGAVLITGLIFMVVLTLIVVASMRTTILEEKMAGNVRDRDLAFQAAEAALRAAELELTGATPPTFSASGPYLSAANRPDPFWFTYAWATGTNSVAYSPTPNGTATSPRYVIEAMPAISGAGSGSLKLGPLVDSGIYKITSRGVGGNPNTVVMLQSTYRR
jgi:type IV pilus assembly protein PilX